MSFRKILYTFYIISLNMSLQGQEILVSGFISDSSNSEMLIGVNVINTATGKGVVSNAYGFYSIRIDTTLSGNLMFSYVGYNKQEVHFSEIKETSLNIALQPGTQIEAVTVRGSNTAILGSGISGHVIRPVVIDQLPAIGGEKDIMHFVKLLPGVQSDEGSSNLSVRGGMSDQNEILLDGSPVYNVNHFGGVFSLFNSDIVRHVKFYKGGFPATMGGRLSSITEVHLKEGSTNDYLVQGTLGLLTSKLAVDGPVLRNKASFLISARTCMYPLYYKKVPANLTYNFYDLNAKFNYSPSGKDRFFLSAYAGRDDMGTYIPPEYQSSTNLEDENSWGNKVFSWRWNHVFSPRLFSNFTIAYSDFDMQITTLSETHFVETNTTYSYSNRFASSIKTGQASLKFDYYLSKNIQFNMLLGYRNNKSVPVSQNYSSSIDTLTNHGLIGGEEYSGNEIYGALQNQQQWGDLSLDYGLRYTFYATDSKNYSILEPRFSLTWNIEKSKKAFLAYDRLSQFIHMASSNTVGLPVNYWIPVNEIIEPKTGWQITTGYSQSIWNFIEGRIELYYNEGRNFLNFEEGKSLLGYSGNWEEIIHTDGKGWSKGLELSLELNRKRYTGGAFFTWSKTDRQFPGLNDGKAFPANYDRRISFNTFHAFRLTERWTFSFKWLFGTGFPLTLPEGNYPVIDIITGISEMGSSRLSTRRPEDVIIYSERNAGRMENFHRLDIAFIWKKQGRTGTHSLNFSVFNVYARNNPYYYYIHPETGQGGDYNNNSPLTLYKQSLIPFLPSVSYSFKFGKRARSE